MIFSQFNADDIVVGRINQVSTGLFSNNLYVSQSFLNTSSQANSLVGVNQWDVKNGQYYIDVYYNSDVYFSIAYGDYQGSGSSQYNTTSAAGVSGQTLTNETKVIYSQYKNILLQPGDEYFSFASGGINTSIDSEAIFAINFSSDKMKDQIDPGNFMITFKGTNGEFSFIDDSSVINKKQNVYNLIRGSIVNGVPVPYLENGTVVYSGIGLFYPTNGIVILNSINLDKIVGINSLLQTRPNNSTSTSFNNYWRAWSRDLFRSIKNSSKPMAVRNSEFVPSTNYFVRVKNKEFNYTNNPTFVSDGTDGLTKGTIIHQELINNPTTYITTIGLYDINNELLAVGKVSTPVKKSFDSELLIKVKIDF